jgi:hypothetical protein
MPFLAEEQVQELLNDARRRKWFCSSCAARLAKDYCRTCDEFYWTHWPECETVSKDHSGHRLTIVPFVEER